MAGHDPRIDRDRDAARRPRNARPRDGLGRPLAHDAVGVARQPEGQRRTPAETMSLARQLFEDGKPFHAHEVFEDAWKAAAGPDRELWRGLAQLAVGATHAARGNRRGAIALLGRGADTIGPFVAAAPDPVDVAALLTWASEALIRVERECPVLLPGLPDVGQTSAVGTPDRALQAVLFDMDGTLVDTEPYWIAAEYALVESFGGTWNDTHAHAIVGSALLRAADYIREHGGVPLASADIVERLLDDVVEAARHDMPWRPGAVALLAELRAAGVPCAMVTMSYDRFAAAVADALPAGTFDVIVTGDQVLDGKPHPEAYLTAAERLGTDPAHCVAIEDSPTGIASAEAAGCVVVAIPHSVPIEAAESRTMVDSLVELTLDRLDALVRERNLRA